MNKKLIATFIIVGVVCTFNGVRIGRNQAMKKFVGTYGHLMTEEAAYYLAIKDEK